MKKESEVSLPLSRPDLRNVPDSASEAPFVQFPLAQNPDVIVADEPVASLDPQVSADILQLLQGICHRDGVAVVCSLHQLHFAQAYADRIVGLAGGRVMVDMDAARFDAQVAAKLYGSVELAGVEA